MTAHQYLLEAGISHPTGTWRLTKPLIGAIHGIPSSRGILRATNGILCIIEQPTRFFVGHREHFVTDHITRVTREPSTPKVEAILNLLHA